MRLEQFTEKEQKFLLKIIEKAPTYQNQKLLVVPHNFNRSKYFKQFEYKDIAFLEPFKGENIYYYTKQKEQSEKQIFIGWFKDNIPFFIKIKEMLLKGENPISIRPKAYATKQFEKLIKKINELSLEKMYHLLENAPERPRRGVANKTKKTRKTINYHNYFVYNGFKLPISMENWDDKRIFNYLVDTRLTNKRS